MHGVELARYLSKAACGCRLGTISCRPAISTCHIRWLGLRAFQRALGRKQACQPALPHAWYLVVGFCSSSSARGDYLIAC